MTVRYVQMKGLILDAIQEDLDSERNYYSSAMMEAGIPMPVELGENLAHQFIFKVKTAGI